ncbi:hypothetical protein MMC25_005687 [Agyrium rufum]|nr:hypothetical protein [Agyrium rufum]
MSDAWSVVLQRHLSSLPKEQQTSLKDTANAEACLDVVRRARSRRKGYDRLLFALQDLIDPIKRFEGVVDVIVQVNCGIASPVWGPLRLALTLASERLATLQNITTLLERLVEPLSRVRNYEVMFRSNAAVHRSICNLYTHLIGFFAAIIRYHGHSSFRNVLSSFDKEFRDASESIRHCWTEIDIAANAANIEEAQLAREAESTRRAVQIRSDVLRWLSPSNVQDDLHEQSSARMADSCEWILTSPAYEKFTRQQESTVLTVLGLPGEGKTFLATFVVESLLQDPDAHVLYFFCKAGDPEKRAALQVLRTLLAQLVRSDILLSEVIEEIYQNDGQVIAQSFLDVEQALGLAFRNTQSPKTYIVIDGLDECHENLKLVRVLLDIVGSTRSSGRNVHLMLSTRDQVEIRDALQGHTDILRLDATRRATDIDAYVQKRVSNMRVLTSTEMREAVVREVYDAAQGLWLYARLILDEIQSLPNVTMIRHQLQNIPRGLQQLYTQILTTLVSRLDEWQLQVAQQIFLWVDMNEFMLIGGQYSIKLSVLETALQHISMGEPVHDPISLVRKLGCHMVDVIEGDDFPPCIDFIHYTAHQYITWARKLPVDQIPRTLKPRRLRELYGAATAAWYLSDHPQTKQDCEKMKSSRGMMDSGMQYFEMAYALWAVLKLPQLPNDLDEEELAQVETHCNQLIRFLSTEQCLTWIEMAVEINYGSGYPHLLANVAQALAANKGPVSHTCPSFEAFRRVRQTFLTDYAYVILRTAPQGCLWLDRDHPVRRAESAPAGFDDRIVARRILEIGSQHAKAFSISSTDDRHGVRTVAESLPRWPRPGALPFADYW